MTYALEDLKQLKQARELARDKAIQVSKRYKIIRNAFRYIESEYDEIVAEYNRLDREYAFALFDKKQNLIKSRKKTKPYNAAKRTAAKALKALESLPEEMRAKIIKDAQDGLF